MAITARWIRLEPNPGSELRAAFAGFARAQGAQAAPSVFWSPDAQSGFSFAIVAPLKLVPGRPWRWQPWALTPCVATYRRFGARAYLDGDDLWLGGRRIAASEAAAVGGCAVVASNFLARLPGRGDWVAALVEDAFRGCIEAQHGWQFDHSWPSALEREAIGGALVPG
jgi:hypothetical protein